MTNSSSSRILDLGAGYDPHRSATDAIDLMPRKDILSLARKARKFPLRGKAIFPPTLKYRFGIDMNKGLPYPDRTFKKVISRYSLSIFGKAQAFSEIFRVLVLGGKVEVWAGDKSDISRIISKMKRAGFDSFSVKTIPVTSRVSGTIYESEYYKIFAVKPRVSTTLN